MFQTFHSTARPDQGPPRLAALRAALAGAGLDGFIVPRADVHQGEYVSPHDERLAWLTGFTGSAGFAVVLPAIAGLTGDSFYDPAAMEDGFRTAMLATAALAVIGGVIAFLTIDTEVLDRDDRPEQPYCEGPSASCPPLRPVR